MSDKQSGVSAEAFDPVAFAEWWLEHIWPEKRPHEFRCFVVAQRLKEEKSRDDRTG